MNLYQICWSAAAEQDLAEILLYTQEKISSEFAALMIEKIEEAVLSLQRFPGRSREGRVKGTREFLIPKLPWIAVIEVDEILQRITVVHIVHTARKYP